MSGFKNLSALIGEAYGLPNKLNPLPKLIVALPLKGTPVNCPLKTAGVVGQSLAERIIYPLPETKLFVGVVD